MSNDLISREDLKATIIEPLNVNDACKNDWYEGYYTAKNEDVMAIDNAPTVETPTIYEFKGCDNCELDRPEGKWVKSKDGYTRCDQCGSRGSAIKARFCHHCGADMRDGEE